MPPKGPLALSYFGLSKRFQNVRPVDLTKSLSRLHSASSAPLFADLATRSTSKHQIYISRSLDPFVNLSIEHFLLQKTPVDSTVLFLYVNRPCVVIGRNQNPWLEVGLRHLRPAPCLPNPGSQHEPATNLNLKEVSLVRRRSGGGTVFHDEGNLNYSVICPTADFNRDKHAEMVVRAIRQHNDRARVNERHDIVLDQAPIRSKKDPPDANDMYNTAYTIATSNLLPLKVSGSAYKLTRLRSLHHGTCLLASPYLSIISNYLRSPATPFLKARGIESVRSPVGNICTNSEASQNFGYTFQRGVIEAFADLHKLEKKAVTAFIDVDAETCLQHNAAWVTGYIDDVIADIPEIKRGITELKSTEWIYEQTPQFVLSSHPTEEDDRARPSLPQGLPPATRVYLKARSGIITSSRISMSTDEGDADKEAAKIRLILHERKLHQIVDWQAVLDDAKAFEDSCQTAILARWLNTLFGSDTFSP